MVWPQLATSPNLAIGIPFEKTLEELVIITPPLWGDFPCGDTTDPKTATGIPPANTVLAPFMITPPATSPILATGGMIIILPVVEELVSDHQDQPVRS